MPQWVSTVCWIKATLTVAQKKALRYSPTCWTTSAQWLTLCSLSAWATCSWYSTSITWLNSVYMHRHMGWPDKKQVRRKHFLGLRHRSKRRFKKLSKKKNYTEISIRQKLKRWLTGQKKSSLCRILYKTVVYSSLRETFEENRSKWCRDIRKVSLKQTTQLEKGTWTEYGIRPLLATLWCLVRTGRWLAAAVVLHDRVFILGQMLCKQTFQRVNNKETRTTGVFSDKTK